ncbi:hypothetical protein V6N13_109239 [Hibiscus sabdariffa]
MTFSKTFLTLALERGQSYARTNQSLSLELEQGTESYNAVDVCYDLVRTLSPFRYLPLPLYRLGKGRVDYLWGAKSKILVVLKLTLFHTLPVDATAAITLAAGGEWLSETLDVLFGKRDVYPGAVVLPNRSAGDAFVWYSKLFSYLYRFATVWLDTMRWQPQLGRMGMKVEEAGKKRLFAIGSPTS